MQASIAQVLENDSGHVRRVVAAQAREVTVAGGGGASTRDHCQLMETVEENHSSHLLPQVERYRAMYEHLYQRCVEDKVRPNLCYQTCTRGGGVYTGSLVAKFEPGRKFAASVLQAELIHTVRVHRKNGRLSSLKAGTW